MSLIQKFFARTAVPPPSSATSNKPENNFRLPETVLLYQAVLRRKLERAATRIKEWEEIVLRLNGEVAALEYCASPEDRDARDMIRDKKSQARSIANWAAKMREEPVVLPPWHDVLDPRRREYPWSGHTSPEGYALNIARVWELREIAFRGRKILATDLPQKDDPRLHPVNRWQKGERRLVEYGGRYYLCAVFFHAKVKVTEVRRMFIRPNQEYQKFFAPTGEYCRPQVSWVTDSPDQFTPEEISAIAADRAQ